MSRTSRRRSEISWTAELRRLPGGFTENWALKLSALGLAFLLWTVVKADNRMVIEDIPVRVVARDADWVLANEPQPSEVAVVFSGPVRELLRVAVEKPGIIIPIDNVNDSTEVHILRTNFVSLSNGLNNTRVEEFRPNTVRLQFDRVTTRLLPLAVRVTGTPVQGFELAGPPAIDPPSVRVSGATSRVAQMDSIVLPPVDISAFTTTDTLLVPIDTTGLGVIVSPRQAQVIVPMRRVAPDTVQALEPAALLPNIRPGGA
jgi:YbbR domain-containing protein